MDIFETATDGVKYFKSGASRLLYIPDAYCRAIPFGEHGLRKHLNDYSTLYGISPVLTPQVGRYSEKFRWFPTLWLKIQARGQVFWLDGFKYTQSL